MQLENRVLIRTGAESEIQEWFKSTFGKADGRRDMFLPAVGTVEKVCSVSASRAEDGTITMAVYVKMWVEEWNS